MMVPANHPLIRKFRTANSSDHVVKPFDVPIRSHLQMHFRRSRSDVIRNRQSAPPGSRRNRSRHRFQQRLRVRVRNRQHRNFRQSLRVFDRHAFRIGSRADSRRQRISHEHRTILHAPPLHSILRPPRALRKRLPTRISVIVRIGINNAANRSMLSGNEWLDPAPRMAISRDYDRALHRDSPPLQFLVIFRHAVIHIHQRSSHVSVNRVRVVRWQLFVLLVRRRIFRQSRLLHVGLEIRRTLYQFNQSLFRRRV